jgi:hypothetical protein
MILAFILAAWGRDGGAPNASRWMAYRLPSMFTGHSMRPPQHTKAARWGPSVLCPLRMPEGPRRK